MKKIKLSWIPTNEAIRRTGISSTDLIRHSLDDRIQPFNIDGEDHWHIDELNRLVEWVRDREEV